MSNGTALVGNYHKYAFAVWGRRVTPAVFGPQVYPGPFVCVLKDGLLSMTNGPPLLVCHWMGYTVICDNKYAFSVWGRRVWLWFHSSPGYGAGWVIDDQALVSG